MFPKKVAYVADDVIHIKVVKSQKELNAINKLVKKHSGSILVDG